MNKIKIIEIVLLSVSTICFIGSHFTLLLTEATTGYLFFGISLEVNVFVDTLLGISIIIPIIIIILILKEVN